MAIAVDTNFTDREYPADGIYDAVLVDIIDEGFQPNPFKGGKLQPKARFVFELSAKDSRNQPFQIHHWVTLSFGMKDGKKSNLTMMVEGMTGAALTKEQAVSYAKDLEVLLGMNAKLNLELQVNQDKKKIKVLSFKPSTSRLKKSSTYTRWIRGQEAAPAQPRQADPAWVAGTEEEAAPASDVKAGYLETIGRYQNHDNERVKDMVDSFITKQLELLSAETLSELTEKQLASLFTKIQQKAEPLLKK